METGRLTMDPELRSGLACVALGIVLLLCF
jgi:hypothetical protein